MKLSKRGLELLSLINKRTYRDEKGELQIYFVPQVTGDVSGAGDARCLRALEAKGLIKRMPVGDYSYAITKEGENALQ